jgi:hypothetical protein
MSRSAPVGRQVPLVDTPIGGNLANRGMGPATTTGTGSAPGPYPGDAPAPAPADYTLPAFASSTAPMPLPGDDDRTQCIPGDVVGD